MSCHQQLNRSAKAPWAKAPPPAPEPAPVPAKSVTLWATLAAAVLSIVGKVLDIWRGKTTDKDFSGSVKSKADEAAHQRHEDAVGDAMRGEKGALDKLRNEAAE